MKKLFLLLFFIMMLCNVISEQKIMLSGINKYGGKTIKYILSPEPLSKVLEEPKIQ